MVRSIVTDLVKSKCFRIPVSSGKHLGHSGNSGDGSVSDFACIADSVQVQFCYQIIWYMYLSLSFQLVQIYFLIFGKQCHMSAKNYLFIDMMSFWDNLHIQQVNCGPNIYFWSYFIIGKSLRANLNMPAMYQSLKIC